MVLPPGKELRMQEKRVTSMKEVDLSDLHMPTIAVYDSPTDFMGKCVARIFDLNKPTDTIMVKDTWEEIYEDIRRNTNMAYMVRDPNDPPCLMGVWL